MIQPITSSANIHFGNGLDKYQEQIKDGITPEYNLTTSPGSNPPQRNKKGVKQTIADTYKGINNTTSVAGGAIKGLVEGVAFGSLFGVLAKNVKENTSKIATEAGEEISKINFKDAIGGTISDIGGLALKVIKQIPGQLAKLKDTPKKYFDYLGKDNKLIKAGAIGIAVVAVAYNVIKSKIQANRRNADLDHSWNIKH